ncbi:hypothetical protein QJQ45_026365, partial [Haematococcus lacustris]
MAVSLEAAPLTLRTNKLLNVPPFTPPTHKAARGLDCLQVAASPDTSPRPSPTRPRLPGIPGSLPASYPQTPTSNPQQQQQRRGEESGGQTPTPSHFPGPCGRLSPSSPPSLPPSLTPTFNGTPLSSSPEPLAVDRSSSWTPPEQPAPRLPGRNRQASGGPAAPRPNSLPGRSSRAADPSWFTHEEAGQVGGLGGPGSGWRPGLAVPLPPYLTFESWFNEGAQRVLLTVQYDTATCLCTAFVSVVVVAQLGSAHSEGAVEPWDLHIGAVIKLLGRRITLRKAKDRATCQWLDAQAAQLLRERAVLQAMLCKYRLVSGEEWKLDGWKLGGRVVGVQVGPGSPSPASMQRSEAVDGQHHWARPLGGRTNLRNLLTDIQELSRALRQHQRSLPPLPSLQLIAPGSAGSAGMGRATPPHSTPLPHSTACSSSLPTSAPGLLPDLQPGVGEKGGGGCPGCWPPVTAAAAAAGGEQGAREGGVRTRYAAGRGGAAGLGAGESGAGAASAGPGGAHQAEAKHVGDEAAEVAAVAAAEASRASRRDFLDWLAAIPLAASAAHLDRRDTGLRPSTTSTPDLKSQRSMARVTQRGTGLALDTKAYEHHSHRPDQGRQHQQLHGQQYEKQTLEAELPPPDRDRQPSPPNPALGQSSPTRQPAPDRVSSASGAGAAAAGAGAGAGVSADGPTSTPAAAAVLHPTTFTPQQQGQEASSHSTCSPLPSSDT